MPLYEYVCKSCSYEFEELVNISTEDSEVVCKNCGSSVERKMSSFASVIAGGTTNETVDMSIGREAEKRWQMHHDKQSKRRVNTPLTDVSLPQSKDGKYMPVMGLGDKGQREKRQEYSTALQEHRQERVKKGQGQFTESGAF